MAYFDLHAHPTMKAFLSGTHPANRRSVWDDRNPPKPITAPLLLLARPILVHQANLSQLHDGVVNLCVSVHHAPEKAMAGSHFFQTQARHIPTFVSPTLLQEIGDMQPGQGRSYFQHLQESLALTPATLSGPEGQRMQVLRRLRDYDPSCVNLIRAIEGAHSLYDDADGTTAMANLLLLLPEHRFLYLTLAHLTDNRLFTHAFGMRMKVGPVTIADSTDFFPRRAGITPRGLELLAAVLQAGILVDVKHLSRSARMQFYDYRRQYFPDRPILCSHAAAAGCSRDNPPFRKAVWQRDYRQPAKRRDANETLVVVHYEQAHNGAQVTPTDFNPWSINLYDEDIREIVESGGLIGISLDKRIAGDGRNIKEVFSLAEYQLFPHRPDIKRGLLPEDDEVSTEDELLTQELTDELTAEAAPADSAPEAASLAEERTQRQRKAYRRQLRLLAHQILYMVRQAGPTTWQCLCIGSDFDGLIVPLRCCPTVLEFDDLEAALAQELLNQAEQGPDAGLTAANVRERVRDLLWRNGWRFLEQHFN